MTIPDKKTFLLYSSQGKCGNFLESFPYPLGPGNFSKFLTIRNTERDSPFFEPNILPNKVKDWVEENIKKGLDPKTIYFQQVPHSRGCYNEKCHGCGRLLNGQVMRNEDYIDLIYGTHPDLNLRTDLDVFGKNVTGIEAKLILEKYGAWEDISSLWDIYPASVIEFTVFDRPVGYFNRPILIWEIRDY